jgi:hypothetical protein
VIELAEQRGGLVVGQIERHTPNERALNAFRRVHGGRVRRYWTEPIGNQYVLFMFSGHIGQFLDSFLRAFP